MRSQAMLTYLDRTSSQRLEQRAQGLPAVGFFADGALAVLLAARLLPRQVMHRREALAPEDGGAVGHGQHARVDKTLQRRRPLFARAQRRLGPVLLVEVFRIQVKHRQARGAEPVQVLHGFGRRRWAQVKRGRRVSRRPCLVHAAMKGRT